MFKPNIHASIYSCLRDDYIKQCLKYHAIKFNEKKFSNELFVAKYDKRDNLVKIH